MELTPTLILNLALLIVLPVDKVIVKPKCPRNVTAAKKFH